MTALEILHNHKNDIDLGEIICYDIETTGLDTDEDEILQLSIIDGYQHVLFNEYIRPKHHKEWAGAQNVNGISPDDVKDKPTFDYYKNEIQDIFSKAKLIVGYNNIQFDNRIMDALGIRIPTDTLQFDVMLEFAPIFGEWNEKYNAWKWQKLCVCADYYGYKKSGNFHDSLEDTKATLYCFFAMCESEKNKKENGLVA